MKKSEPAFPITIQNEQEETMLNEGLLKHGMSKRFYAACAAMQGLLASPAIKIPQYELIIKTAYIFADELLKQENNELT